MATPTSATSAADVEVKVDGGANGDNGASAVLLSAASALNSSDRHTSHRSPPSSPSSSSFSASASASASASSSSNYACAVPHLNIFSGVHVVPRSFDKLGHILLACPMFPGEWEKLSSEGPSAPRLLVYTSAGFICLFTCDFTTLLHSFKINHSLCLAMQYSPVDKSIITIESDGANESYLSLYHDWKPCSSPVNARAPYTLPLACNSCPHFDVCPVTGHIAVLSDNTVTIWSITHEFVFEHKLELCLPLHFAGVYSHVSLHRNTLTVADTHCFIVLVIPAQKGSSSTANQNSSIRGKHLGFTFSPDGNSILHTNPVSTASLATPLGSDIPHRGQRNGFNATESKDSPQTHFFGPTALRTGSYRFRANTTSSEEGHTYFEERCHVLALCENIRTISYQQEKRSLFDPDSKNIIVKVDIIDVTEQKRCNKSFLVVIFCSFSCYIFAVKSTTTCEVKLNPLGQINFTSKLSCHAFDGQYLYAHTANGIEVWQLPFVSSSDDKNDVELVTIPPLLLAVHSMSEVTLSTLFLHPVGFVVSNGFLCIIPSLVASSKVSLLNDPELMHVPHVEMEPRTALTGEYTARAVKNHEVLVFEMQPHFQLQAQILKSGMLHNLNILQHRHAILAVYQASLAHLQRSTLEVQSVALQRSEMLKDILAGQLRMCADALSAWHLKNGPSPHFRDARVALGALLARSTTPPSKAVLLIMKSFKTGSFSQMAKADLLSCLGMYFKILGQSDSLQFVRSYDQQCGALLMGCCSKRFPDLLILSILHSGARSVFTWEDADKESLSNVEKFLTESKEIFTGSSDKIAIMDIQCTRTSLLVDVSLSLIRFYQTRAFDSSTGILATYIANDSPEFLSLLSDCKAVFCDYSKDGNCYLTAFAKSAADSKTLSWNALVYSICFRLHQRGELTLTELVRLCSGALVSDLTKTLPQVASENVNAFFAVKCALERAALNLHQGKFLSMDSETICGLLTALAASYILSLSFCVGTFAMGGPSKFVHYPPKIAPVDSFQFLKLKCIKENAIAQYISLVGGLFLGEAFCEKINYAVLHEYVESLGSSIDSTAALVLKMFCNIQMGNFVRAFDFSSVALKQVDSVLFQRYINTAFVFARRTKLQQKSKPCKQLLRQLAFVYVDENIGLQYKDIAQKMTQRLLTQMQDGNAKE